MSTECMQMMENNNNNNYNGENMENRWNNSKFPIGMKVLAVDDNEVCLTLLTTLLTKCQYQVKSLTNKTEALAVLKAGVENFDIVLTDVNMDETDGFKLLEAGLELDIPVIMISACDSKAIVMKGVRYGAVDYLIKPVRLESVKTIWQHVYRKNLKRRKSSSPEDDDVSDQMSKKDRMKWSHHLHERFLNAVQILGGYEKAVPTKILELMNDPCLTRERVASHLQKYRNCLKKKRKLEEETVPTTTTNNISYNAYNSLIGLVDSSSNASSVATTLSNRPILGNTSRTMFRTPNYHVKNNPWLPAGYTRPLYHQQSMMHIDRNYKSSVSNRLAEPLFPQLPPDNLFDIKQQAPEELADPRYSMFGPIYETPPSLNNIHDDTTSDYPGLLEHSEDGRKDQYYHRTN